MATEPARVLLVDDEPGVLRAYQRALAGAGFHVDVAGAAEEVRALLAKDGYDLILSDVSMPHMDGFGVLLAARAADPDVPVVLMTGAGSMEDAMKAVEVGALRYLLKPIDMSTLRATVAEAVQLRRIAALRRQAVEHYGHAAESARRRTALGANFQRALGTLRLAFQPIVRPGPRQIRAYEALARNDEPALMRPDLFFDAAEQLDRLVDVGRAVRALAAAAVSNLPEDADLFVNLHPSDLADEQLYSAHAPLSRVAKRVVLEITERASLDGMSSLGPRVEELRQLGFRVAIDDLGAGYAGLSAFVLLRPDVVKLDMSLVRNVDGDLTRQRLIASLLTLCRQLGVEVVAEGVETVAERDALTALGCELLQGYLFARPGFPFPTVAWP